MRNGSDQFLAETATAVVGALRAAKPSLGRDSLRDGDAATSVLVCHSPIGVASMLQAQ